jgi:hypothetical protein
MNKFHRRAQLRATCGGGALFVGATLKNKLFLQGFTTENCLPGAIISVVRLERRLLCRTTQCRRGIRTENFT